MKLYVIVPVLNEAPNIPALLNAFHELDQAFFSAYELSILLVDDGSGDGTAEIAQDHSDGLSLHVIKHETNRGPGAAFGSAFEHLAPSLAPEDWVATMEGDNTSRHELLQQMLTRAKEGYDVALASPYMYGGGIVKTSSFRIFLSHMANLFVKEALGIHGILTMSSFFRLYHAPVILQLQKCYGPRIIERSGFESMIELLIKMMAINARISEVAMVLDTSRRAGKSKMKIMRTIVGYLAIWFERKRWIQNADPIPPGKRP